MHDDSQSVANRAKYSSVITDIRNYTPSSFKDGGWEVVQESNDGPGFVPLKLSVVPTENATPDALFAIFDNVLNDSDTRWHSKDPNYVLPSKKEPKSNVIDEKILEEIAHEKYNKGHEDGLKQGKDKASKEYQEKLKIIEARFGELSASINEQLKNFYEGVEKEAVKLSLEVAKKVLSSTVDIKPDYILNVIRAGIASLGAATPLSIRVSHEDLEFLEVVGTPTDISPEELGIKYIGDESIKSGCVIETDFGQVDVQLDAMWDKIKNELAEVYK